MSVVTPRALATGIEAAFAATLNTPASKTSGSAAAPATQAAPFPALLGEMVELETGNTQIFPRARASSSKAATAHSARASEKTGGERKQSADGATTPNSGEQLMAPDPVNARAQAPWRPQDCKFAGVLSSGGSTPETSGAGTDGAAGRAAPDPARAGGDAAPVQIQVTDPAATPSSAAELGQTWADMRTSWPPGKHRSDPPGASELAPGPANNRAPLAAGEQPGKPAAEADAAFSSQPTEPALEPGRSATVLATQALHAPQPRAAARAAVSSTESADGRTVRREPVDAVPAGPVSTSGAAGSVASADDHMLRLGWIPVAPTRNTTESQPPLQRAADLSAVVQAAYAVEAEGIDTATSVFARPVGRSRLQGSEQGAVNDREAAAADHADAAGTSSQSGNDSFAEQGTLAFQAVLVPASASDSPLNSQQASQAGNASGQHSPPGTSVGLNGARFDYHSTRDQDPSTTVAAQPGQTGGASQTGPAVHGLSAVAPVSSNIGSGAAAPGGPHQIRTTPPPAARLSAQSAAEAAVAPKAAAAGPAREIQLELRDADARVNVRLVERAGTVQVDVRTPDSHLAGALRDDLPALSARLEQSGLRAETWHDAPAAAGARIRMAEPAASTGFQSSQNESRQEDGGRDPHDGQPQDKRQNQPQRESKEFSWLYTSLQ